MSRIFRHIKDGFIGVFRHFALSFSSISSMMIMLTLMSIFMLLNENIIQITQQIEENVSLYVQIESETTKEETETLKERISKINGISDVQFSSKHEELELFIKNRGDEGEELFGGFRGEDNPFLDVLIANVRSGYNIKNISKDIEELDHIYKVSFGGDATQTLLDVMSRVRDVGFIFVVVLSGVAIFLIANTINATIHSRSEEISIMRTVGATNWYIRWPFIIEGMLIGILGSAIPILITVFGYTKFYEIQNIKLDNMFQLVAVEPLIWKVSLVLILTGALVGAVGSLLTVSRRLRWTR